MESVSYKNEYKDEYKQEHKKLENRSISSNDIDTKMSLLMNSLTDFYKNDSSYIETIKNIVNQESDISLRILDWFITNYSKKKRVLLENQSGEMVDVYQNYKLQLKSFSKKQFDPFCRKNKIIFYYSETDDDYIETSCGQLCFFRWCFQNNILEYVNGNLQEIEQDMKTSLLRSKTSPELKLGNSTKKRKSLSPSASRSIHKRDMKYTISFD
jgi:uncharacterized protein YeeX (DUF496 family)